MRARYWREALDIHATEPWLGSGAGAYATVRTRFRDDALAVRHAHGYVVQTLADLGWVGLIVSLLAAAAWLLAAARATGVRRADRGLPYDAERIGMLTLVVVVLVFARALGDRLDVVRAGQRGRGHAVRRLGGRARAAARPARAPRGPARARRRRRGRTPAGSRGSASGCRRCARWPCAR